MYWLIIILIISFITNLYNKIYSKFSRFIIVNCSTTCLIIRILLINVAGLVPYSLTFSLYIWARFLVSLIIWISYSIRPLLKTFKLARGHLLPLGAPVFLWNFLIFLEAIRQCIRPLTLRLRLSCNLMAGHVIISLTSNLRGVLSYLLLRGLVIFEIGVRIIQALVYNILINIYKKERN